MGKRKGRSAKKVPRPAKRQATRSLKDLPSDYVVVHISKFICDICRHEVVSNLLALPRHRITDTVRKEHEKRAKEVHEDACKTGIFHRE